MSDKCYRALRLAMEEMDIHSLRTLWITNKRLRQNFHGLPILISNTRLVIPSLDFFEKFRKLPGIGWCWTEISFPVHAAMWFMENNHIAEAVYLVDSYQIVAPHILFDIVICNGSLTALEALQHTSLAALSNDEIYDAITNTLHVPAVSSELYEHYNVFSQFHDPRTITTWSQFSESQQLQDAAMGFRLVMNRIDAIISNQSKAMFDYYNKNTRELAAALPKGFLEFKRVWPYAIAALYTKATEWDYLPAIEFVKFAMSFGE